MSEPAAWYKTSGVSWTNCHAAWWAARLTASDFSGSATDLTRSIANARVVLNPHRVDAALFAIRSPLTPDLRLSLAQQLKQLEQQIAEVRRLARLAETLADQLEMQRSLKGLEQRRTRMTGSYSPSPH